jgi:dipeptide/tripeptide permease
MRFLRPSLIILGCIVGGFIGGCATASGGLENYWRAAFIGAGVGLAAGVVVAYLSRPE